MSASIHFYIRSERPHADLSAQVYLLFTLGRNVKTKISIKKNIPIKKEYAHLSIDEIIKLETHIRNDLYCWDESKERATSSAPNWDKLNHFMDSEKKRANDIILKYDLMSKPLTTEVFRQLFCKPTGNKSFSEYFMEEFDYRRQNKWSAETIKSYKSIVTKIQQFKPKLTLNDIDHKFLVEYEDYMLKPIKDNGCGNSERTVANNMKVLKTLLYIAIKNGDYIIDNSPFKNYKVQDTARELTTRDYLEPNELAILEKMYADYVEIDTPLRNFSAEDWIERNNNKLLTPGEHRSLQRFLFSCYTGLRFRDMLAIEKGKHIFSKEVEVPQTKQTETRYYIELSMHKTRNTVVIPLIDKAILLFDVKKEGHLFDSISNQKVNAHLKSIQEKSGINKHLTFHVSRHSFATICFLYGIDERVGQKLLGHKNRKFTEIYTHLSHNKLFLEMDKFNSGINKNTATKNQTAGQENIVDFLPMLQNLSPEKITQVMGLLKLLGS